jgi:hypothetical protein
VLIADQSTIREYSVVLEHERYYKVSMEKLNSYEFMTLCRNTSKKMISVTEDLFMMNCAFQSMDSVENSLIFYRRGSKHTQYPIHIEKDMTISYNFLYSKILKTPDIKRGGIETNYLLIVKKN